MKTREDLITNGILMPHNMDTYLEAYSLFESGENMVGITQATGTGKTYLLAQFIYDECYRLKSKGFETDTQKPKEKRALILSPTNILANQTAQKLMGVVGPNMKNVTATTYANLLNATDEDLQQHFDVIVLDEFHRLGAEKWGPAVQRILDANPNAKVLGLTATPVRYLDEARDMGEELFDGVVVEGPNLGEAIEQGILPKPKYILGVYSYDETIKDIEDAFQKCKDPKRKAELERMLFLAKKEIANLESTEEIIARNINEAEENLGGGYVNGKYIAYCSDINHSKAVIDMLPNLLKNTGRPIKIYTVNYKLGKEANQEQIDAFENDNSDAIKVMVAINMFDEGLHIDGVKGVFCFSNTTSPIKHLQRIGRSIDADNKNSTPLIFDLVNNIDCLKDFGTTCRGGKTQEEVDEYVSPFSGLPFDIDEKSLTLAELLCKLDFLKPDNLTPAQWIDVFEEYFTQNPNTTNIPNGSKFNSAKYGSQNIGGKMNGLKRHYNNGQGTPTLDTKPIIDWFIQTGRANMLAKETRVTQTLTLTPAQWIDVFEEFFAQNPNATNIPRDSKFNSAKHGSQNIGTKLNNLKQAYNNGQGKPSQEVKPIIDWFIQTGRADMIAKKTKEKLDLAPAQWIEVFEEFFAQNPNTTNIPSDSKFNSDKYGSQNIGKKLNHLKKVYNNGQGTRTLDTKPIIDWFIQTGRADMIAKETRATQTLTPAQWIEVFEEFFAQNPNANNIPRDSKFNSAKHGSQNIGEKMKKLKQKYNNGQGIPALNTKPIIDWFIQTGRADMLAKEKPDLTPAQWIEVFVEFFAQNPNTTNIPQGSKFNSAKYGSQNIGSKLGDLKTAYNNGQGKLSQGTKTIIDWFIQTGRADMIAKETRKNKNSSGDDDQTM